MSDKPYGGRLEWWVRHEGYYTGLILDDPQKRWPNGTPIYTSYIISEEEGKVETRNTLYDLGQPYEKKT